jgi:hypothetical protein
MTPKEMIAVLEAFERGEKVDLEVTWGTWVTQEDPQWNFRDFNYRIAPKKEMTLVEKLRAIHSSSDVVEIIYAAADRITEIEKEVEELKQINRDRARCMHERIEDTLQHIQQQKWVP